jgi:hypothetical protein
MPVPTIIEHFHWEHCWHWCLGIIEGNGTPGCWYPKSDGEKTCGLILTKSSMLINYCWPVPFIIIAGAAAMNPCSWGRKTPDKEWAVGTEVTLSPYNKLKDCPKLDGKTCRSIVIFRKHRHMQNNLHRPKQQMFVDLNSSDFEIMNVLWKQKHQVRDTKWQYLSQTNKNSEKWKGMKDMRKNLPCRNGNIFFSHCGDYWCKASKICKNT